MKFYYLDPENYEIGPFDEAALTQAARNGEIGRETLVRNHMMEDDWRQAWRYEFLTAALPPPDEPAPDEIPEDLLRYGVYARFLVERKAQDHSRFNYKVIPDYAKFSIRLMAFLYDFAVWLLATFLLCLLMIGLADKEVIESAPAPVAAPVVAADGTAAPAATPADDGVFAASVQVENATIRWRTAPNTTVVIPIDNLSGKFGFMAFWTGLGWLIYFAWSIGFRAQTLGMWYWGVVAVRPNLKEVFAFRAFCYTVAFVLLGWTFIFVFPFMGMSLPDKICGVRLVRNSSRALKK